MSDGRPRELLATKVLVGAWGQHASVLLERAAERRGAQVHRLGKLTMLSPPDLVDGDWCCWLFGEPEDRGALAAGFGLETRDNLAAAFGGALSELGERACELLWGRFVVVAYNRGRNRCTVARDQLGAQPLIHARTVDGLLFSEHECDLLDLLPRTPGPDRLALLEWIGSGLTPPTHTLYEGVQRLPAGHRLILSERLTAVERWWRLRYEGIEEGTATELAERLREAAFAAVERAAAGSQQPAVKLSGGLDSACVAAGMAAKGFADGRALAIGGTFAAHPVTDESELIKATARHTHLPLELIAFDSDSSMLAPAIEHIARWRLPPATPNLFLWEPVMARARELGVDLMLDGEGGDELFGLAPWLIADMLGAGRLRTAWSLTGRIPGIGLEPDKRVRLRVLRRYGLRPLLPIAALHRRERARATSSGSIAPSADAHALVDLHAASQEDRRDGPLWWQFLAESLIDERDLVDMGAHFRREATDESTNRRHPFLYDLQLIETVLRLPPRAQFDPVRDRPLLREGLTGHIPEAVRSRHAKSHFTPLVLAGLRADEPGLIEPLRRADAPVRAYVAPEALDRKIEVPPDDRAMLSAGSLWRVAIANRWLISQAHASS
jgi:asparagine synthase (glutamine-hydrolysing)